MFAEETSLLWLGEGMHLATIDSTVVSQNPGGRLQEGDGKFLFVPLHLPLFFKHNFNGMVGI